MASRASGAKRGYGVKLVRGPFVRLPPHELACDDENELLAVVESLDSPLAADLFCGAGGLSLGLQRAGFEVVFAVDHDAESIETHRAYFPGLAVTWDLSDDAYVDRAARIIKRAGITLVAGGPPCQPFSKAGRSMIRDLVRSGRRPAHDQRRDLWQSFLQIVATAKPQAVVMENVPDMALDHDMLILRTMVDELENLGYCVGERVLDAFRYEVPQFRQRFFLVALAKRRAFCWPAEKPAVVSVDNAIGDLPPVEGGWRPAAGAAGSLPYSGPQTAFQMQARAGVAPLDADKIFDHITRPVRDDDAVAFAMMDAKTRYSELDADLKRYRDDIFDDKYKRLDANDLSRTITAHIAKDGYWYIHPSQDRTLTVREAARIQTFPDWFRFAGPPSAAFRQIGNAVPPAMAEAIGVAVLSSLEERKPAPPPTTLVSQELANWFGDAVPAVPWLRANSRWLVVQAELLWSRLPVASMTAAWAATSVLATPQETIAAEDVMRRLARVLGRGERWDVVRKAADWFMENPAGLDEDASLQELTACPHVTPAVGELAVRVVPGAASDPIVASAGALRVAARFTGEDFDRVNKGSDGRLGIARLVGAEDWAHSAHLALIDLAASICTPARPTCGECPLEAWCIYARSATTRGSRRAPRRSSAARS